MMSKVVEENSISLITEDDVLFPFLMFYSSGATQKSIRTTFPDLGVSYSSKIHDEYNYLEQLNAVNAVRRYILAEYPLIVKIPHKLAFLREKMSIQFRVIRNIQFQYGSVFSDEEMLNQIPLSIDTIYRRLNNVALLLIEHLKGDILPVGVDYTKFFNLACEDEKAFEKASINYFVSKQHYRTPYIFIAEPYKYTKDEESELGLYNQPTLFKAFIEEHFSVKGVKDLKLITPKEFKKLEVSEEVKEPLKMKTASTLYVDCDNTGYFNFLTVLSTIKKELTDKDAVIRVKLFADPLSRSVWSKLKSDNVEVEFIEAQRMLESKSVVDLLLVAHFCRDKEEGMKKYIVSSDSDFFILNTLGEKFTVIFSEDAVSNDYLDYLETNGIEHFSIQSLTPTEEVLRKYIEDILVQEILGVLANTPVAGWNGVLRANLKAYIEVQPLLDLDEEVDITLVEDILLKVYDEVLAGVTLTNIEGQFHIQYEDYKHKCEA